VFLSIIAVLGAQGATVIVTPPVVDFASVYVGDIGYQTVNIAPFDTLAMVINNYIVGDSSFFIDGVPSLPYEVSPGSPGSLMIAFMPATYGVKSATLIIETSPGTQVSIPLTGFGDLATMPPMLNVADSQNFGAVTLGSFTSETLYASLTTEWGGLVGAGIIDSCVVEGCADFRITNTTDDTLVPVTFPFMLNPGRTLLVYVKFQPTDVGVKDAYLKFYGHDGVIYETYLTGDGQYHGPTIIVTPNSLIVHVDSGFTKASSFLVGNSGDSDLAYNFDFTGIPAWITVNPNFGGVSPANVDSIAVQVDATSIAAGNYSYLMGVTCNDPDNPSFNYMITVEVEAITVLADFHGDVTSGHPPLRVHFIDDSYVNAMTTWLVIDSWQWDCNNDGSIDSYEQSPYFTYTQPGIYSVRLTVTTNTGVSSTKLRTAYINATNSAPVIIHTFPPPDMLEDTTWGPYDIAYIFSDPNGDPLTLSAKSSLHLQATITGGSLTIVPTLNWNGSETVTVTAVDPYGLGVAKALVCTVNPVNDPPALSVPANLYFIHGSVFRVNFGNYVDDPDNPDSELSLEIIPMGAQVFINHTYLPINSPNIVGQLMVDFSSTSQVSVAQQFTVSVDDNMGRLVASALFTMHVLEHFSPNVTLGGNYQFTGETVEFHDSTLGNPDHWLWDFGDGGTSTEQHPTHQYLIPGSHDVRLTLGNSQVPAEDRQVFIPNMINLSGTAVTVTYVPEEWTITGSPYNIFGAVTIAATDLVTIDPNVQVNLFNETPILIRGSLQASGVRFQPQTDSGHWGGLHFAGGNLREPSVLSGCILVDAQNPILIEDDSPLLSNITITLSDTTRIANGTGLQILGQSASQVAGIEILDYHNGVLIDSGDLRDTPSLTNVRIRNTSSTVRDDTAPITGVIIKSTANLNSVEIDNYDTGLSIDTDITENASNPSLTNVRIRNTSSTFRGVRTGMSITGKTCPHLDDVEIENVNNAILVSDLSAVRDTPSLTNVRIRNTSSTVRDLNTGIKLSNVPGILLEDADIDSFAVGLEINTTRPMVSNPILNGVSIHNSLVRDRNNGQGLVINGDVAARINDLEIDDYAYGLSYQMHIQARADQNTSLTNVRIRNTSSTVRQLNTGAVFHGLGKFSVSDLEVDDYSVGVKIETADQRNESMPSLTNVRIRNTSSTVREENVGIFLGSGVKGYLKNSTVNIAWVGILVAEGNQTVLQNNTVKNCVVGIRSSGTNQLPISKTLIYLDTDHLMDYSNYDPTAFELNGSGNWDIYQNTIYNYFHGMRINQANVQFHSNIVWSSFTLWTPFQTNGGSISCNYCDINYSGHVAYPGWSNINQNPQFASLPEWNFNLSRISPCIDTGNPSLPPDPDGSTADMGAFVYLHRASGIATPRFIVVGSTVSFTNTSLGHDFQDTIVSWDIGDDHTVESTARNFNWTFNSTGIYNVRLTMQSGSLNDTVLYPAFVVVSLYALKAPQNLSLALNGSSLNLAWDPVTQTVNGDPASVEFYLIYKGDAPQGIYNFAGLTVAPQTQWADFIDYSQKSVFYLVLGFAGTREEVDLYIERNPQITR